jgi:hypothetical protein
VIYFANYSINISLSLDIHHMELDDDELGTVKLGDSSALAEGEQPKAKATPWDTTYQPNANLVEMIVNFLIRVASTSNESRDHVHLLFAVYLFKSNCAFLHSRAFLRVHWIS